MIPWFRVLKKGYTDLEAAPAEASQQSAEEDSPKKVSALVFGRLRWKGYVWGIGDNGDIRLFVVPKKILK